MPISIFSKKVIEDQSDNKYRQRLQANNSWKCSKRSSLRMQRMSLSSIMKRFVLRSKEQFKYLLKFVLNLKCQTHFNS